MRWTACLPIAVYAVGVAVVWPFEIDDAYISMRYARNLVRGCGLAFNCGEPPLEGFTNMLLVLIEAGGMQLGMIGTWVPKTLNFAAGLWLLVELARRAGMSAAGMLAAWSVATATPIILWTAGGLETVMFAALATVGVMYHVDGCHRRAQALLVLATICRPEGALYWLVTSADTLYRERARWRAVAAGAGAMALYGAAKLWHFGSLVPATHAAKERSMGLVTLAGGAAKLASHLSYNLALPVAALAVYGAWLRRNDPAVRYVALLAGFYAAYLVTRGYSVSMDHGWRLFVPLVALTGALLLITSSEIDRLASPRVLAAAIACLTVSRAQDLRSAWLVDINAASMRSQVPARELGPALQRAHVAAGKWLAAHGKPSDTVVAHSIGAIGWYSDMRVIDTWSLVTPELIALRRRMRDGDSSAEAEARECIANQRPEFFAQDTLRVMPVARDAYEQAAAFTFMRSGISDVYSGKPYVDSGLRVHRKVRQRLQLSTSAPSP